VAEEGPPSDEEFAQRLEEELRRIKVADLLVQTIYTVSSLGYRRLGEEDRDLDQARLAIDAMKALVPVLEGSLPEEMVRDLNQVTANMQLAYAQAASSDGESSPQPDS
jgi:hypothetical protein